MKSKFLAIGALATGLVGVVQAEEQGFYAGSGGGMYFVDIDDIGFDESAMTLRMFGGYKLNDYISFEAGYTHLFEASGGVSGVDVDMDGSTLDLSVRPSLPLSDNFVAYGILGWTDYDLDITASAGGVSVSESAKDDELHYGVGAAFNVNDSWNIRGEYTMLDISGGDFSMLSLSAVYNFR